MNAAENNLGSVCEGVASGCMLADWPTGDPIRLPGVIAMLRIGKKTAIQDIANQFCIARETISRDLHILIYVLKLPIKRSCRCAWLIAPIQLCSHCAQRGQSAAQAKPWRHLPRVEGLNNFRATTFDAIAGGTRHPSKAARRFAAVAPLLT